MPKAQNSPIRMYFILQTNENNGSLLPESECKACGLRMKGNHASNMERHIRRSHPAIYEKYLEIKSQTFNPESKSHNKELSDRLCAEFKSSNFNFTIAEKKPSNENKRHRLSTTGFPKKDDIVDACVELVTVNGRPFSLMNDSGFRLLLDPFINKICPSLIIDENNIKKYVIDKASKIKASIFNSLQNQIIGLKLDCITYCNRSFLGIHAQSYVAGEVKQFTLSVVEINVRMDSAELNEIIWNELNAFGVSKQQVYCATIDNSSEFMKSFEPEENSVPVAFSPNPCSSKQIDSSEGANTSEETLEAAVQVITVYNEFEDEDNDLDSNTTEIIIEKLHLLADETMMVENDFGISNMKCIAGVLQSAITNTFKMCPEIAEIVKESHHILRKLHSPAVLSALSKSKFSPPPLDLSTKWKSVYTVVEKLLILKPICVKLSILPEDAAFWNKAVQLTESLKHYRLVAETLQTEELTPCDVYKLWFNCILETSKLDTVIAQILVNQMKVKQETLFENISFVCAIFLDPRFNNMVLNEIQKADAIKHLLILYQKISLLYPANSVKQESENGNDHAAEVENGTEDELERIFREQEYYIKLQKENAKCNSIELALRNFCENEPRLKTNENIFHFWERKKIQYPEIYNLVCVLLSVPATQKSVSCLISQVKYILDSGKIKMSQSLFSDVLLIRANSQSQCEFKF